MGIKLGGMAMMGTMLGISCGMAVVVDKLSDGFPADRAARCCCCCCMLRSAVLRCKCCCRRL